MNFENLGDKIIDDQGNVKTIAGGQDARLYYLDVEGNRKKYLLEGEGGGALPENLVTSVNGQTGDVKLTIPTMYVNSFNGKTLEVIYPALKPWNNNPTATLKISPFATQNGTILTYQNPIQGSINVAITETKRIIDVYYVFTTAENWNGNFTYSFPTTYTLTNTDLAIEANKTYILCVNEPFIFLVELKNIEQ